MISSAMQAAAKAAHSASANQPFSWENATRLALLAFLSSEECVEAIARGMFEQDEHYTGTGVSAKQWTWDDFPANDVDPRRHWLRKSRAAIAALKQIVERER